MVIGGANDASPTTSLNRIFRRLKDGVPLVGMHRNLYWRTARGWELDGGAYIAGARGGGGRHGGDLRQAGARVLRSGARRSSACRPIERHGRRRHRERRRRRAGGRAHRGARPHRQVPGDRPGEGDARRSCSTPWRDLPGLARVGADDGRCLGPHASRGPPLRGHRARVRMDGRDPVVRTGPVVAPVWWPVRSVTRGARSCSTSRAGRVWSPSSSAAAATGSYGSTRASRCCAPPSARLPRCSVVPKPLPVRRRLRSTRSPSRTCSATSTIRPPRCGSWPAWSGPGGRWWPLEFHVPEARWARDLWRLYTRRVMPAIGGRRLARMGAHRSLPRAVDRRALARASARRAARLVARRRARRPALRGPRRSVPRS